MKNWRTLLLRIFVLGVFSVEVIKGSNPDVKWTPISDKEKSLRKQFWTGEFSTMVDMVESNYGSTLLPKRILEKKDEIATMNIRDDDVILLSYPKVGSTWMQELLWQLQRGVDFEGSKTQLAERVPFLELETLVPRGPGLPDNTVEFTKNFPSPRIFKTHLHVQHLPSDALKKAKIVYMARNPKDVCVSFYYHELLLQNHKFNGTFEQYADFFQSGKVAYGNYMTHLMHAWNLQKAHPYNFIIIWYEDMKRDIIAEMKKILAFTGWPSIDDERLLALQDHLEFRNFRQNPSVNREPDGGSEAKNDNERFLRRGIVGDWKNHFTTRRNKLFDQMVSYFTSGTDIRIIYEQDE